LLLSCLARFPQTHNTSKPFLLKNTLGILFFSTTPKTTTHTGRGDGTVKDRATAAADAHYGASVTLAYFKDVHGRSGVDGRGSGIKSRVHLGKAYDNAYCEGPFF
jgi:Zn-dependent metalloprotease